MRKVLLTAVAVVLLAWSAVGQEPLAPIKQVEIGKNRELRVNGKPFFPIMAWAQDAGRFIMLRSMGFNTFNGSGETALEALQAAQSVGGCAMVSWELAEPQAANHPALLAYTLRDEPDTGLDQGAPKVPAAEVLGWREAIQVADPSRPVFLNFTSQFLPDAAGGTPAGKAYYEAATKAANILCFHLYPIYQRNRDDRLVLVADGVAQLRTIAGPAKPVWAWIETSKGSRQIVYEQQKEVKPEHTRAEVWMAIIRGATGIGYFTHAWQPHFNDFAPGEAMRLEIKRLNGQITRLAPAILAAPAQVEVAIALTNGEDKLPAEIMAREHDGHLWIFANNLDMKDFGERKDDQPAVYRAGRATITVAGLKAGTKVEVVDEDRTIESADGQFVDDFPPLGVHIYKLKM